MSDNDPDPKLFNTLKALLGLQTPSSAEPESRSDVEADGGEPEPQSEPETELTPIPKAVVSPPNGAGNNIVGKIEDLHPELGYTCATTKLLDKDQGQNPYNALDFAQVSRDYWREELSKDLPSDVNLTHTVQTLGGTGEIALAATSLPEDVTQYPVIKTMIGSDRMHGTPGPDEARNTYISYELMQHKIRTAGYGHILLSNMDQRFGYREFLDEAALFQGLLPWFDTADLQGSSHTGAATRIDIGNDVDNLRDSLRTETQSLYEDPWFIPSDWNWVNPPEEMPLGDAAASRAFALVPERFEGQHYDVQPNNAPELYPQTADVGDAFVVVLRPISDGFINQMLADTREWLFEETAAEESTVGDEVRRIVRLRNRVSKVDDEEAKEELQDLIVDLKNRE